MLDFAGRLLRARQRMSLSQTELADLVGLTKGAISSMERGITKAPTPENLFTIAKVLKVNPQWLGTGHGTEFHDDPGSIYSANIPLLDWSDVIKCSLEGPHNKTFTVTDKHSVDSFALEVNTDAMVSDRGVSFIPGAQFSVDPSLEPRHEDYVIALKSGAKAPILRQLLIEGGNEYLAAHQSNRFPTIEMTPEWKIIGVVCQIKMILNSPKDVDDMPDDMEIHHFQILDK